MIIKREVERQMGVNSMRRMKKNVIHCKSQIVLSKQVKSQWFAWCVCHDSDLAMFHIYVICGSSDWIADFKIIHTCNHVTGTEHECLIKYRWFSAVVN